ncbi:MAG: hypothetical protein A2864_01275 [Candidatus Woykebacteria bacterium RIFCSPHIGHO2_01_FULL_39_12]|uniref:Transcription regulator AsnC/Lrp ligand binding domain-containing protein n=2 Tax=Candidatus Woykeibacteriota TaxID=1817899 RepID=A0A1G1WCA7_9BACT|nr:MAG: hypothetical protein A2134_02115 [Candidatus Woykebacteria bacterium RBG_16_39_9b]OGY26970.1 MAG: hypothetical protein A2864_01275 [Candidatus Woykebacteria bacterium RIFCSPHIGHO2_01_FULL_39_12]
MVLQRRRRTLIKVYVLVVAEPGSDKKVAQALREMPEVTNVHEVMGPYDVVVEFQVETMQEVPPILTERIRTVDGIESTTSLVTLPD